MVHARVIPFVLLTGCGSTPVMGDAGPAMEASTIDAAIEADLPDACGGCQGACYQQVCAKRIFASSQTFDGASIQSVLHADQACADMAKAASLSGRWLAWISDELGSSPASRFGAPYAGPYVLAKNPDIRIVKTADDFPKDALEHAIDHDENGMLASGLVYTQTDSWGDVLPETVTTGSACQSWTDGTSSQTSMMGNAGQLKGWSVFKNQSCDTMGRIYCFEQ